MAVSWPSLCRLHQACHLAGPSADLVTRVSATVRSTSQCPDVLGPLSGATHCPRRLSLLQGVPLQGAWPPRVSLAPPHLWSSCAVSRRCSGALPHCWGTQPTCVLLTCRLCALWPPTPVRSRQPCHEHRAPVTIGPPESVATPPPACMTRALEEHGSTPSGPPFSFWSLPEGRLAGPTVGSPLKVNRTRAGAVECWRESLTSWAACDREES